MTQIMVMIMNLVIMIMIMKVRIIMMIMKIRKGRSKEITLDIKCKIMMNMMAHMMVVVRMS